VLASIGAGGESVGPKGALSRLIALPFGDVLVYLLAAGLACFGGWRAVQGMAYRVLLHPGCPATSPGNSWAGYLSASLPRAGEKTSGVAEIQFNKAREVNKPDAIGNLRNL
jgi:hypothetical protein